MRISPIEPPRRFRVRGTEIAHGADLELQPDEQVTFVTPEGRQYDVVRKSWGYYATPSLNGRLKTCGFRSALVSNRDRRKYVLLVEVDRAAEFDQYCAAEGLSVIAWLDEED